MAFNLSKFTNTGLELLSAASATKTLVIDNIYCLSVAIQDADLISQPPSYFANHANRDRYISASVVSIGNDPNSNLASRIVIGLSLQNVTSNRTAKTIIITAHYNAQGEIGPEVTFYGLSDSSGVMVPYNSRVPVALQLAISFAFSRTSAITVAGSVENYLLADEVSRFVTTHATNSTVEGEAQTILGTKTFYSEQTIIDGDEGGIIQFNYNGTEYARMGQTNANGLVFKSTKPLDTDDPTFEFYDENDEMRLGYIGKRDGLATIESDTMHMGTAYVTNLCAEYDDIYLKSDLIPNSNNSYSIGSSSYGLANVYTNGLYAHKIACDSSSSAIYLDSTIIPNFNNYYSIGNSSYKLSNIHTASLYTASITSNATNSNLTLYSTIVPNSNNALSLGNTSNRFNFIYVSNVYTSTLTNGGASYTINISSNLVPNTASTVTLGTSAKRYSYVYADTLNATNLVCTNVNGATYPPVPSGINLSDIPIGSIIMASVHIGAFSQYYTASVGAVSRPSSTYCIRPAESGSSGWNTGMNTSYPNLNTSAASWKLLNGLQGGSSLSTICLALIMRIA